MIVQSQYMTFPDLSSVDHDQDAMRDFEIPSDILIPASWNYSL